MSGQKLVVVIASLSVVALVWFQFPSTVPRQDKPEPMPVQSTVTPGHDDLGVDALGIARRRESAAEKLVVHDPAEAMVERIESLAPTNLSARARANIHARQESLCRWLDMLEGKTELPSAMTLGLAASKASTCAVLILHDYEGKSKYFDESVLASGFDPEVQRLRVESGDPGVPRWTLSPAEAHLIASGGAAYEIAFGEYPEFDTIKDVVRRYANSPAIADIPLDQILLRSRQALGVQVPQ